MTDDMDQKFGTASASIPFLLALNRRAASIELWARRLTKAYLPDDLVVVRNKDADEAGDYRVMKHSEAVGDPQWEITNINPKNLD